jgi:dihydrofolate synthase/folylpolyglutamate synthase
MNLKPIFNNSADVFSWLGQFINLERGQTHKSFQLERMQLMAEIAGHPEKSAPVIHIAGSKGKGSVCSMIASILQSAGMKTAKYMSPHVVDYRERITLNGNYFDEEIYLSAAYELAEITTQLMNGQYESFNPNADGEEPTFFELLTLYFFLCARKAKADVMVLETGMGGRLDATNIADPLVSVITIIELEHQVYLGNTLSEIAGEKAGIIKKGRPVVLASQEDEALNVFQKTAADKDSPLFYLPNLIEIKNITLNVHSTNFLLVDKTSGESIEISVPIPGAVQAENAAMAYLAVKKAFPAISNETITKGISLLKMIGRFEQLSEHPVLIIDGAHTKKSIDLCSKTFTSLYGREGILIFGCAAGKDVSSMAKTLIGCFKIIIITTPGTFKISDPTLIYETFTSLPNNTLTEIIFIKDTAAAVHHALHLAKEKNLPILGTGSFYLAAEIRKVAQNHTC